MTSFIMIRFKVGQNIVRPLDNRLESPEWGHVIRSFFSEIDLFPGSGSIASYKYNSLNINEKSFNNIIIYPVCTYRTIIQKYRV